MLSNYLSRLEPKFPYYWIRRVNLYNGRYRSAWNPDLVPRLVSNRVKFGARLAKELLLTGDSLDAERAYQLGMVSKVFPVEELSEKTVGFARRVAGLPTMANARLKSWWTGNGLVRFLD